MKKKYFLTVFCIAFLVSTMTVSAEGSGDRIKSCGRIYFNNKTENDINDDVIFDSKDLYHLADRIDVLIEVCR